MQSEEWSFNSVVIRRRSRGGEGNPVNWRSLGWEEVRRARMLAWTLECVTNHTCDTRKAEGQREPCMLIGTLDNNSASE